MIPPPKEFGGSANGYRNFLGTAMFYTPEFGALIKQGASEKEAFAKVGEPMSLTEAVVCNQSKAKECGAQFHFGLTGDYLEKKDDRISALIAHDKKGGYFRVTAHKGVILADGDFSGNKEMVMDLLQEYADLTGNGERYKYIPNRRKGISVQMALWAGGHMESAPRGGMWACGRSGGSA